MNSASMTTKTVPFEFSLYDTSGAFAIYITDNPTEQHSLIFELKNISAKPITFPSLADSPDSSNFEICFRKGTLSSNTLKMIKGTSGANGASLLSEEDGRNWKVRLLENSQSSPATVSLFFRYIGQESLTLQPADPDVIDEHDTRLNLRLQNISADAGGGTRGTRVKFVLHKISEDIDPEFAFRENFLYVINHRGNKEIPLHVGFSGPNHILNDGARHEELHLKLRIQNIVKPGLQHWENPVITLRAENKSKGYIGSVLSLTADVQQEGEKKDWALCTSDEFKPTTKITLKKNGQEDNTNAFLVNDEAADQGESKVIAIQPTTDIHLAHDDYIEIGLSGFQSSLPAGHAHMYLHYRNIPGYQDSYFVLTVEKSPLMFGNNDESKGNIGIGVTNPKIHLAIGDDDTGLDQKGDGVLTIYTDKRERVRIDQTGRVGIGTTAPEAKLDIKADTKTVIGWYEAIRFSQQEHSAITHPGGGLLFGMHRDRNFYFADIKGGFQKYVMQIEADTGNVGIGTTTPQKKLDVNGDVQADKFFSTNGEGMIPVGGIIMWHGNENNIPTGWALCNGQNETPDLRDRFIVGAGSKDYPAGSAGGMKEVSLTLDQMPKHTHSASTNSEGLHNHTFGTRGFLLPQGLLTENGPGADGSHDDTGHTTYTDGGHSHTISETDKGGDQSHENRPPYYALCFIMKVR